jgi:alanine-synthesizing transaminase
MIIVFSSRLNWDAQPNPLTKLLEQKRAAGTQICDLTISNPTTAGFTYPPIQLPSATQYDPHPRGLLSAREAISSQISNAHPHQILMTDTSLLSRDRQGAVMPDQILITASTSEAYAYLFKLLCDPGDEILTPRPSYPLFEFLAALESVTVRQYPLRYDGAWHIDFTALESALSNRTRAIVVVNPNNPTGSYLKPDESERLQSTCAARGIAILVDEVFFDYRFSETSPPTATITRALTFRMAGLSKLAGLPQMKLGWIIAEGPGHEAALDRLELIADTYLSVATPVQLALPALLAAGESVRAQIRERTRANLATLKSLTAGTSCEVLNVEGGWSAILQVPQTRTEEEWVLTLLADHNILVQPGFFFDFESEAYLILSLLTPPDIFNSGVDCLVGQVA